MVNLLKMYSNELMIQIEYLKFLYKKLKLSCLKNDQNFTLRRIISLIKW